MNKGTWERYQAAKRRKTIRALVIIMAVVLGAILLSSFLQSCTAPQVCRYCWVAGK